MDDLHRLSAKNLQQKIDSGYYQTINTERCICGGVVFRTLATRDRINLRLTSKLCEKCGLIHTDPKLAEQSMAEFYDQDYYPVYFNTHGGPTGGAWLGDTNFSQYQGVIIYEYCRPHLKKEQLDVLELGCGNGRNLSQFKKHASLDAIEVHPTGIEYSTEHGKAAMQRFGIGNIFNSVESMPEQQFDLLILSHVLEHFSDLDHWMPRLSALLRDNALLYVEVPGVLNLSSNMIHKLHFKQYLCLPHSYCYTLRTLAYVASLFGFTLLEGDEFVRAIFQKNATTKPLFPSTKVPAAILEMMALLETPHYALTSQALMADLDGDYERGIALGYQALAKQPDFSYALEALANLFAHDKKHEQAVKYASLALQAGIADQTPTMLLLGRELETLKRFDEAERVYKKHLTRCWWDMRAETGLARISNLKGDYYRALQRIRSMEERWIYEPHAVLEEGRALKSSGSMNEALDLLSSLQQAYPFAPEPLFELADIAHRQGRYGDAETYYKQGLDIQPTFTWGWYCLAEVCRSLEKPETALMSVEKSLSLQPTMIQARILQAGLLAQMGRHEEAIAKFQAVHADHPDRADLLLNIADICRYRSDYQQALATLDQYQKQYGNSAQLENAYAKLNAATKPIV